MSLKKINIGLDIGITSVGYSVIDEDNNILKMGVRLFDDPANPKDGKLDNQKRREARSKRRNLTRARNRKDDFIKFLIEQNWYQNKKQIEKIINYDITKYGVKNPIELKLKALSEKISKEILVIILFHYLKHRGFFHISEEMLKEQDSLLEQKEFIYPSIRLNKFYQKNNYYKNSEISKNIAYGDYVKEIEQIFKVQEINFEFACQYIKLFSRKRDFAEGPGSKKSPTKYGLWSIEDGKLINKGENLWDLAIGKCTYCDNLRAAKNSPYAELFNLLNDLANIYLNQDKKSKLTIANKKAIFELIADSLNKNKKIKNVNLKLIKSVFNENILESNIGGYRVDTKKKALFTKLESLSKIVIFLLNLKVIKNFDFYNLEQLKLVNDLYEQLRKNPADAQKRIDYLNSIYPNNLIENQKLIKDLKSISQNHGLCNDDLVDFIKFALALKKESNIENNNDNQMVYFHNKGKLAQDLTIFRNRKYIPENLLESNEFKDQVIMSPTAKRAYNQSIKVLNALLKNFNKEYQINNIAIEMARDKNTAEQRKNIEKMQKNNKEFEKILKNDFDFDINNHMSPKNANLRTKLKLYIEQDKIDIYDGKNIDLKDLINNPNKYNVDHIIPYSLCFINGMVNKVLTKNELNAQKGQKTPYQWLSVKNDAFEQLKTRVLRIYEYNKTKQEMLLFKGDPGQELEGFIARNLVDTRYASKLVLNILTNFFKENKQNYSNVKIKSINGNQTNYARYNYFYLKKERDDYQHHAVDALIINFLGSDYEFNLLTKYKDDDEAQLGIKFDKGTRQFYNVLTGEIIETNEEKIAAIKEEKIAKLKMQIDKFEKENKILFSRKIISKNNPSLSNETIYSIKWDNHLKTSGMLISKINLIEDSRNELDKYFDSEKRETKYYKLLLCFQNDPYLYKLLYDIYNENKDNIQNNLNPFLSYSRLNFPLIKKTNIIKIVDLKNQIFLIKTLKRELKQKDYTNLMILKKQNSNAVMESLNWKEIRVYQNVNNSFFTLPINQKILSYSKTEKNWIADQEKINSFLEKNKIENQKYLLLKRGSLFINKKDQKLFYVSGGNFNLNMIDLKCLNHSNKYNNYFPREQMQISFSTIAKEYDICQSDVLGNIYNRQDIFEFFKKK